MLIFGTNCQFAVDSELMDSLRLFTIKNNERAIVAYTLMSLSTSKSLKLLERVKSGFLRSRFTYNAPAFQVDHKWYTSVTTFFDQISWFSMW